MYARQSNSAVTQVVVAVTGVDVNSNMAEVMLRDGSSVQVHTDIMVGAVSVTPAIGEQWIAEKGIGGWKLLSRLPYNDPPAAQIPAEEGQARLGSGRGPVELAGTSVNLHSPLKLNTKATSARPSAATSGVGAMIFDSTLGRPIWSNGTNWVDATGTSV